MPVISVHRYSSGTNIGGTIVLSGSLDVSDGGSRTLVLNPSIFTAKGTWTLYRYTSLIGSASSIVVDASLLTTLGLSSTTFTPVDTGTSLTVTLQ